MNGDRGIQKLTSPRLSIVTSLKEGRGGTDLCGRDSVSTALQESARESSGARADGHRFRSRSYKPISLKVSALFCQKDALRHPNKAVPYSDR